MDSQARTAAGKPSFENYEPSFSWDRGEERDILFVHLPGFSKENLRVQVDGNGTLTTSGERPLDGSRRRRFSKEFKLPENCIVNDIRAKFENNTLYVMLPKIITPANVGYRPPAAPTQKPSLQPAETQKPSLQPAATAEPKPAGGERDKGQETDPKLSSATKSDTTAKRAQATGKDSESTDATKMEKKEETSSGNGGWSGGDDKKERKPEKEEAQRPMDQAPARHGVGGIVMGLRNQRKTLLFNMVVAVMVLVGLGIYMNYKLRNVREAESD